MRYEKGTFATIPNIKNLKGVSAITQAVYVWMCYHANQDDMSCFPSRTTLAKETKSSVRSVTYAIKELEDLGMIEVVRSRDGKSTNTYTVLIAPVQVVQGELNPIELNPINKEIGMVIEAFVDDINPACAKYYGNKTQRAACARLLKLHGLERIKKAIAYIKANRMTQKFIPTITTPLQLEDKWTSLEVFAVKQKNGGTGKGKKILV